MEPFTTSTQLTKKEYTKFFYRESYKKPATIIYTLLGLYFIVISLHDFKSFIAFKDNSVVLAPVFAIFIVLLPTLQVMAARKKVSEMPAFKSPQYFTFSEDGVTIKEVVTMEGLEEVEVVPGEILVKKVSMGIEEGEVVLVVVEEEALMEILMIIVQMGTKTVQQHHRHQEGGVLIHCRQL